MPPRVGDINWQSVPEGQRIGLLEQILGVPYGPAARTMATMAFARNEKNAPPGGPFQTQLPPNLEAIFSKWALANDLFDPKLSFPDYDMRGWWNAMRQHDPKATYKMTPEMHPLFPDTFVTPYSLDFGPKSMYWRGK